MDWLNKLCSPLKSKAFRVSQSIVDYLFRHFRSTGVSLTLRLLSTSMALQLWWFAPQSLEKCSHNNERGKKKGLINAVLVCSFLREVIKIHLKIAFIWINSGSWQYVSVRIFQFVLISGPAGSTSWVTLKGSDLERRENPRGCAVLRDGFGGVKPKYS